MAAEDDDAMHGSSVSRVIIDHALQVLLDSWNISVLGIVGDVEDHGDVLPVLHADLADDVLNVAFAEVPWAARLPQVEARLHGARLENVVVHVLLVLELFQDHARFPQLAAAENHEEADLAAWGPAALDHLGKLQRQNRAADAVLRELDVKW